MKVFVIYILLHNISSSGRAAVGMTWSLQPPQFSSLCMLWRVFFNFIIIVRFCYVLFSCGGRTLE